MTVRWATCRCITRLALRNDQYWPIAKGLMRQGSMCIIAAGITSGSQDVIYQKWDPLGRPVSVCNLSRQSLETTCALL